MKDEATKEVKGGENSLKRLNSLLPNSLGIFRLFVLIYFICFVKKKKELYELRERKINIILSCNFFFNVFVSCYTNLTQIIKKL